jgi:uncharacterized protein YpmB
MRVARAQTTAIAREAVGMTDVDAFYHFTRTNTYYSVEGKDSSGKEVFVIVAANGKKATVVDADKGLTENQAKKLILQTYDSVKTIQSCNIGQYNNKTVWEVVAKTNKGKYSYYLIDFETGEKVKNTTEI